MNVKLSVTGVKEIDKVLKSWPNDVSHAVLGAAHLSAAAPLIEKEKLLAPEGPTGNLVDSIGGIKTPIKKANVIGEVIVGPRRGGRYKGNIGHIVEFGTKPRRTKKGANRGVMPAEPFAEPAFQQTNDKVVTGIKEQIGRKMVATMKRNIK